MNYYDIEKIYDEMEQYLIDNIKRNLMSDMSSFHLKEEKKLGFNWEAWQTAKLRELKRYRKENKNILNKYVGNIDSDVADVLRREYQQGKKSAYKGFKKALEKGYKSSVKVKDSFFRINDRKIDALIKSVNDDFKKANQAVLRMTNDTYRQVVFEASMYNTTGVMTGEEAIRKAVGNFEVRGINSIVYSNGARHKISNYARMAIRTASTRAYLQGNGEFRKKIGQTLVILSKHGTACELCQPWEGRVLIDDIYSGGSKNDGKYPLLSEAMKQGLYHPNCRHALGTYYPELEEEENKEIVEEVEKEEIQENKKPQSINDVFKKVALNGIEAAYAKDIENRLLDLQNTYPINKDIEVTARPNKKAFGYNTNGIKTVRIRGKAYARYNHNINFSNTLMKDREYSLKKHKVSHELRKSKLVNEVKGLSTVDHEYAHAIDTQYLLKKKPELMKFAEKYKTAQPYSESDISIINKFNMQLHEDDSLSDVIADRMKENRNILSDFDFFKIVKKEFGDYATTNRKEFLAEGFANMRTLAEKDKSDFLKEFEEIFNEEFKKVVLNESNK